MVVRNFKRGLLGLVLLGAIGCGGSGSSPTTTVTTGTDFNALANTYLGHYATDPATAGQRTAESLAARKDVKQSGVMPDGTPYARFDSGTVWAFVNNRTPAAAPIRRTESKVGAVGVPNGLKTAAFNTLVDSGWASVAAPTVATLLKGAGYTVFGGSALIGTLEHWESLTDITFLYVDAHGFTYKGADQSELFALVTATEATPQLLQSRAQDFADQKLIVVSTLRHNANKTVSPINRVAITQKWFGSRNFLASSSHVFLNACKSGQMTFREIGNPVKAGLVLKWNGVVSDLFATQFALNYADRMLNPAKPRQNWLEVYNELGSAGRTDPITKLEITFNEGQGSFDQFLPEINSFEIGSILLGEANEVLTVRGIFGDVPGVVLDDSAGGTPLQVISWSKGSIQVKLNNATTRIKIQANGRETNTVALPYWKLSGRTGGAFNLNTYMFATLGRQNLQMRADRPGGFAGPYRFEAAPGDFVSIGLHCEVNGTGGNDEIVVTSPNGRVTSAIPAMSGRSWDRDLGAKEYFRLQRLELDGLR